MLQRHSLRDLLRRQLQFLLQVAKIDKINEARLPFQRRSRLLVWREDQDMFSGKRAIRRGQSCVSEIGCDWERGYVHHAVAERS